ncbi:hypothetical protein P872_25025 [Rhodonellum psychrophilum GCM71 = DSM 17998]|uniref:histidine kinase n=3 Tax=Cytophagaceae TaxID=89373 RepID=U5C307_9BACT|nr:7TM diverse intracellular signaling domain-containing protein [Rhodonellum psychrophilum]ERM84423.1 hypothetical protein P872_25025 [Rhodonellum psychrophilum GCM71 = DSM 17998]SDY99783.1 7TMR-DISM extracellular 2 [Rhodonellum ikkaensis]
MKLIQNHKGLSIIAAVGLFFILSIVVIYYSDLMKIEKGVFVENFILLEETDIESISNINEIEIQDPMFIPENIGFHKGDLLIRFSGKNLASNPEDIYFLEFSNPLINEIFLYKILHDGSLEVYKKAGINLRDVNIFSNPRPVFEFSYEDLNSSDFLLKVNSKDKLGFTLELVERNEYLSKFSTIANLVNVYIGIMLSLFLYNIIIFLMIKDRVYLFYSFYVMFIALAQLSLLGYSYFYFLGQNADIYSFSVIAFPSMAGIFAIGFIKLFLKTSFHVPKLDKYLVVVVILYSIAIGLRLLGFVELSYRMVDIAGLVGVIFFVTTGVIVAKLGYRPAIYFLVAWGVFLIGLVFYIMQNQGVLNLNIYANFPMLLGTAMEAILLSLALADRINILKKEKEDEQHEKLEILKDNERLIKEQNTSLEQKVKIRTEELEETLRNLQNTQIQLINQEKMASLGQLTAGIAHEINNPINFVSSNISPLKRDIADLLEIVGVYREKGGEEFSEATKKEITGLEEDLELDYILTEINQLLKGMEDGAKRTVEIVKGLRLFSRVDEQDVKKVDLHDGINSTLVLLNSSMSGRIKIIREFGELPMVECLAGKINQVFMNIITNSIHALTDHLEDNPNPEITISTRNLGDSVRIEIGDNGPGMPEHVKQRIFEPFFTTKEVGQGTGLGLSIVYTIIENHKGKLEVLTEINKGTSFIIILPHYQKLPQNE